MPSTAVHDFNFFIVFLVVRRTDLCMSWKAFFPAVNATGANFSISFLALQSKCIILEKINMNEEKSKRSKVLWIWSKSAFSISKVTFIRKYLSNFLLHTIHIFYPIDLNGQKQKKCDICVPSGFASMYFLEKSIL